jgi:peptide/nickel transport system ATP-binding protein
MKSLPVLGRKEKYLEEIKGVVPAPYRKIVGCKFADRCPEVIEACHQKKPPLKEIETDHWAACIRR